MRKALGLQLLPVVQVELSGHDLWNYNWYNYTKVGRYVIAVYRNIGVSLPQGNLFTNTGTIQRIYLLQQQCF